MEIALAFFSVLGYDTAMDGHLSTMLRELPLTVRMAHRDEMDRWRALMNRHHYLGFDRVIGEAMHYVATVGTEWVALLGWGSAALKCAARDRWVGWNPELKFRRLRFVANNVRFLILPDWRRPNLASRVLSLNLKRLSHDWTLHYGHPILLAETFVDDSRFRGTCYRAAGWQPIGHTRGYSKSNRRYWLNGQPKLVFVRPLTRDAASRLRATFPPPAAPYPKEVGMVIDVNRLPLEGEGGLMEMLRALDDPRKPRGIRHPVVTIVAIAICAALSGALSFAAIAEWASWLTPEALKKLGSKRPKPPSEPTIRRTLQALNPVRFDARIGDWLMRHLPLTGRALAVDGKTLRGAHDDGQRPPHILGAILHGEKAMIAQIAVEHKTNEIPKLPELLAPLPIEGAIVTADAMHTQKETARYIVEEKHADYLFTVKDNQPTLKQDIADLDLVAFPPGMHHHRQKS